MNETKAIGSIDSVYCGSGVDGKGLRCVVFFSGCNLRCPFCHNPETLYGKGKKVELKDLLEKLRKYKPYFRRGGVTISGGEPFLQKQFYLELCKGLHREGIRVAVETNGHVVDEAMIDAADELIVDIKNQETDDYACYQKLRKVCAEKGKRICWTNVLVPGVNDTQTKIEKLCEIVKDDNFKFLPFRKLCLDKYKNLDIEFPYSEIREADMDDLNCAYSLFNGVKN